MPADEMQPPDDHDEDTQARHVARRAELLPEELAVGSDDPQAQAQAILEEAEERTEHPDRDVSLPASPQPSPETDVD
jgi:hypothetical protein